MLLRTPYSDDSLTSVFGSVGTSKRKHEISVWKQLECDTESTHNKIGPCEIILCTSTMLRRKLRVPNASWSALIPFESKVVNWHQYSSIFLTGSCLKRPSLRQICSPDTIMPCWAHSMGRMALSTMISIKMCNVAFNSEPLTCPVQLASERLKTHLTTYTP